jgi:glycine/D-amino acid oxidase-like deaminating enzyme
LNTCLPAGRLILEHLSLPMHTDYLIIGQGISGTWLSYYLQKEGKSFIVIDNNAANTPSRISAGIINPVTGRRHVTVWMAEEIIPYARDAYTLMGDELAIQAISHKNILDFFPSPQMRHSFLERVEESSQYVHSYPEQNHFNHLFNYEFGCGEIRPVHTAHLETILPAWRERLKETNQLMEEEFDIGELKTENNKVIYKDIVANAIIFCDGNSSTENPWFRPLPFAPNKGELLIAEIPDLPGHNIYKKGMMLAPLATPGLWWIGSNYAWEFDNTEPTNEFRVRTESLLNGWLKMPFRIIHHFAGIRPATLERRPFVGTHPLHPNIGILNGMGTKGCSLAPFFARQLTDYLLFNIPITPEADIKRFSRMLAR